MSYLDWHVGMKVVYLGGACTLRSRKGIRRLFGKWDRYPLALEIGGVYELSFIGKGTHRLTGNEDVGIELKEDTFGGAGLHPARYFRPIQARRTDISVFTTLLKDTKRKVPA